MNLIYGTKTKMPANTRLTNGYTLYDWVMRMGYFPSFWGRDISGEKAITNEEMQFLKERNCKIAFFVSDFSESSISQNDATSDALKTIEAAKRLGIPQNRNIAIFVDVPSEWSVNHNWMIGYASHLMRNGYIPGFIGNTDSSKNFNFDRQCSHYIQATRKNEQLHALYWATEPKYSFHPEAWAPFAPSEMLPKDIHVWSYGELDFHGITAEKCYAREASIVKHFYTGGN